MLFNSFEFIYLFLPVTLVGFFLVAHFWERQHAIAWLVGASFVYYGSWNPLYLALIGASVGFNFLLGAAIARTSRKDPWRSRTLAIGVGPS